MRAVVLALAVLVAGAFASPQNLQQDADFKSNRVAGNIPITLIEEYQRRVINRGLDPYRLERAEGSYTLPMADVFTVFGWASDITLDGIANVAVNSMGFDESTITLNLDVAYPKVRGSVSAAGAEIYIIGYILEASASGSITINNLGASGSIKFGFSIFEGINIESANVVLAGDSIESDLTLKIFGYDVSDAVNNALQNTIPAAVDTYHVEITQTIEYFLIKYLNPIL